MTFADFISFEVLFIQTKCCVNFYTLHFKNHTGGCSFLCFYFSSFEPRHDKSNKLVVRPAKTQVSLGIRPVWSESSLSAWRNLGPLATHWAHSKDSDQTGQMPRLIWVFIGRTLILLVLSWCGSFIQIVFGQNCDYHSTFSSCNTRNTNSEN